MKITIPLPPGPNNKIYRPQMVTIDVPGPVRVVWDETAQAHKRFCWPEPKPEDKKS